jgi:trigger factor
VERPAASGDHVVIDYVGSIDGEPFEGGEGRDQLLELGSGRLIPGFEEQLVGASAGDQRAVEVTFPEEYPGGLGGKQAQFDVTVTEVKAKRLPELDDELASEAAGFDTLAELREDIAARLSEADERAIEREFEEAVLEAAVSDARVEIPEKLVHARAHELLDQTLSALSRQGISKDAYLRISGKDEETLAHEAEPEAASALRREAVLAAVVEAEQIEPSEEELREALEPAAERSGSPVDKMLERLGSGGWTRCARTWPFARRSSCSCARPSRSASSRQRRARSCGRPARRTPSRAPGSCGHREAEGFAGGDDPGAFGPSAEVVPDRPAAVDCYIRQESGRGRKRSEDHEPTRTDGC